MHSLIPPRLFLACATLALLTAHVWPGGTTLPPWLRWLGATIGLSGLVLLLWAWTLFRRARTEIHTFREPRHLVTRGPYRFSRNPMYLGFLCMLLGLAAGLGSAWSLGGPMVFFLTSSLWYIPVEEQRCARVFGQAYRVYQGHTRRWV